MDFTKVKIVTTVPSENADDIRRALGSVGAGVIGEYSFCSFSITGNGYFTPSKNTQPYIGEPGRPEVVIEERIEVTCDRQNAKSVIDALKSVHPYEEPICDIYPLLNIEQL